MDHVTSNTPSTIIQFKGKKLTGVLIRPRDAAKVVVFEGDVGFGFNSNGAYFTVDQSEIRSIKAELKATLDLAGVNE